MNDRYSFFNMFKKGILLSFPIMLGYIPVGFAFGSSAVSIGFTPLEAVFISTFIFAGSSQFALITLMNSSFIASIVVPIFLNLRHIIYSSIIARKITIKKTYLVSFGLTDEVFATSMNCENDENLLIGLEMGAYISWVFGTFLGAVGSNELLKYEILSRSLSFSLVSLFFGLLIPHLKGRSLIAAIFGSIVALVFHSIGQSSAGIIVAGLLSPVFIYTLRRQDDE